MDKPPFRSRVAHTSDGGIMNEWNQLKERILGHPITTILGLVLAVATAVAGGGGRASIIAAVCVTLAGAFLKDPQLPGGGTSA